MAEVRSQEAKVLLGKNPVFPAALDGGLYTFDSLSVMGASHKANQDASFVGACGKVWVLGVFDGCTGGPGQPVYNSEVASALLAYSLRKTVEDPALLIPQTVGLQGFAQEVFTHFSAHFLLQCAHIGLEPGEDLATAVVAFVQGNDFVLVGKGDGEYWVDQTPHQIEQNDVPDYLAYTRPVVLDYLTQNPLPPPTDRIPDWKPVYALLKPWVATGTFEASLAIGTDGLSSWARNLTTPPEIESPAPYLLYHPTIRNLQRRYNLLTRAGWHNMDDLTLHLLQWRGNNTG
jgi:Protein phosphatase 2C